MLVQNWIVSFSGYVQRTLGALEKIRCLPPIVKRAPFDADALDTGADYDGLNALIHKDGLGASFLLSEDGYGHVSSQFLLIGDNNPIRMHHTFRHRSTIRATLMHSSSLIRLVNTWIEHGAPSCTSGSSITWCQRACEAIDCFTYSKGQLGVTALSVAHDRAASRSSKME